MTTQEKTKRIQGAKVNINEELHKKMKITAIKSGKTLTKLTEELLTWFLRNENISQELPQKETAKEKKV